MGSKKAIITLVILLILAIGGFIAWFAIDTTNNDSETTVSDTPELLPPPSEPRDLETPTLEVRSDEEELDAQIDEAVEEALDEAERALSEEISEDTSDTSSVSAATRDGWTEYNNSLYDYGFDVPADWNRGPETTPTAWVATYTTYDPSETNNVNNLPGTKLEVLVQENTEGVSFEQLVADTKLLATIVHSETDTKLGEYNAKRIEADLPSGRSVLVVAVRDLDVFTITFTGRDTEADASELNGILESFVL